VTASTTCAHAGSLIDAGRFGDAIEMLAPHLATNPEDAHALCLAARAFLGLKDPWRAREAAQSAASLDPNDEWPLRLLSIANARLGRVPDALQAAAQAVAVAPNLWLAHYALAEARYTTKQAPGLAWRAVLDAGRLAPNEPDVFRLQGQIAFRMDKTREARAAFGQCLRLNPTDAVARHELARLSLKRGRLIAAANGFASSVSMDPRLQVGVSNLEVVAAVALWVVSYVLLATILLQMLFVLPLAAAITTTAVLLLGGIWFWRKAGRRTGRFLRTLPRRSPLLGLRAGLLGAGAIFMWLAAILGTDSAWTTMALVAVLAGNVAGRRWTRQHKVAARP